MRYCGHYSGHSNFLIYLKKKFRKIKYIFFLKQNKFHSLLFVYYSTRSQLCWNAILSSSNIQREHAIHEVNKQSNNYRIFTAQSFSVGHSLFLCVSESDLNRTAN